MQESKPTTDTEEQGLDYSPYPKLVEEINYLKRLIKLLKKENKELQGAINSFCNYVDVSIRKRLNNTDTKE